VKKNYKKYFIKILKYVFLDKFINLANIKEYRKLKGGYWEKWYIDCIHSEIWFERTYKQITNRERPGCGFGTPYCEYYNVDMFGYLQQKDYFNIERILKLKRIIKENYTQYKK